MSGISVIYPTGLDKRNLRHSPVDEIEWFKCDECECKTKHKSNLTRHIRAQDANVNIKLNKQEI
jgi:hypothetical protein